MGGLPDDHGRPRDEDRLLWFGASSTGASAFRHVNVPVGIHCDDCDRAFDDGDEGVVIRMRDDHWGAYHRRCPD